MLGVPLNEAHYRGVWEHLLASGDGVMFLMQEQGFFAEERKIVGGIGGVRRQDLLTGEWKAIELFWYVSPEFRKSLSSVRLLDHFEKWAVAAGCKRVAMIHMELSMPAELKEFYGKRNYRLIESHYEKELTCR